MHQRVKNILWGLQWGVLMALSMAIGALFAALDNPPGFATHRAVLLKVIIAGMVLSIFAGAVLGLFRSFTRSIVESLFVAALAGLFVVSVMFLVDEFSYATAALTVLFGLLLGVRIRSDLRRSSQRAA